MAVLHLSFITSQSSHPPLKLVEPWDKVALLKQQNFLGMQSTLPIGIWAPFICGKDHNRSPFSFCSRPEGYKVHGPESFCIYRALCHHLGRDCSCLDEDERSYTLGWRRFDETVLLHLFLQSFTEFLWTTIVPLGSIKLVWKSPCRIFGEISRSFSSSWAKQQLSSSCFGIFTSSPSWKWEMH